jgi:hypothetical protein
VSHTLAEEGREAEEAREERRPSEDDREERSGGIGGGPEVGGWRSVCVSRISVIGSPYLRDRISVPP